MKPHRLHFTTLAIPALLLAASSCLGGGADDGSLEKASQAFGESGCPSAPDRSFVGVIPDPGITTSAAYNNSHCYKSYVASVASWTSAGRAELVVTDAFNDNAAWHPASALQRKTAPPPALSQTDCQNLFIDVVVYQDGVRAAQIAETGVWKLLSNGTMGCQRPTIIFSGLKRADDIIDTIQFTPGKTYTFAATYRTFDGTSAPTLPLKILTPFLRCGLSGEPCCVASDLKPFTCEDGSTCAAARCAACGLPGEICCDRNTSGGFDDCPGLSQCIAGTCSN
jgi:hypothetical protein